MASIIVIIECNELEFEEFIKFIIHDYAILHCMFAGVITRQTSVILNSIVK